MIVGTHALVGTTINLAKRPEGFPGANIFFLPLDRADTAVVVVVDRARAIGPFRASLRPRHLPKSLRPRSLRHPSPLPSLAACAFSERTVFVLSSASPARHVRALSPRTSLLLARAPPRTVSDLRMKYVRNRVARPLAVRCAAIGGPVVLKTRNITTACDASSRRATE